ncbi:MAG: MFS transporter [Opitutaceae bacterium]|nr:MFS transporter [Opitutaceae bacterium]
MPGLPSSTPPATPPARRWTTGTLVYTTGGIALLFCWLLFGDFAWAMRERSVGSMAQWYLKSIGVPNLVFGLLITSFPALLALVLSPIISVKSDRHRGKWGRRIPFLLVTTPLAALGMIGVAVTPVAARWAHGHFPAQNEMMVSVVCFGVFWTLFELGAIASQAVFGGLVNDVVPRPLLGRFYGLFRAISLIDGVIFNYWLIGKAPDHFTLMLSIIGVFYGGAFMLMCFKVKEGGYPPPPPLPPSAGNLAVRAATGVRGYFSECFLRKPYYISVYALLTFGVLAAIPVTIYAIPYATSLEIPMDTYGKCMAATYAISFGLSYFIGWLVDMFHPLRMAMVALGLYACIAILGTLFATSQTVFIVLFVAHGVCGGCYITSASSIGQRLFPRDKFAQYASAGGMMNALVIMCLVPAVGLLIDSTGGVYRWAFACGGGLALTALFMGMLVYRQFIKYGGHGGYTAP